MMFELHNTDCLDVLPELHGVDAIITDPPFGTNYSSGRTPNCSWFQKVIRGDETTLLRDAVLAWAAMQGLPWACFGSIKADKPLNVRGVLVWDKGPAFGMGDLGFPWKPSWELIFIGGQGWEGKRDEGVLRGPPVVSWESKGRTHPNEKPVWLICALLAKLPAAQIILDPFMGVGTVGVACMRTGHKFIGIEIDPNYFALAKQRIEEAASEGPLFAKAKQPELFEKNDDAEVCGHELSE